VCNREYYNFVNKIRANCPIDSKNYSHTTLFIFPETDLRNINLHPQAWGHCPCCQFNTKLGDHQAILGVVPGKQTESKDAVTQILCTLQSCNTEEFRIGPTMSITSLQTFCLREYSYPIYRNDKTYETVYFV
jgi:hypothetical protein